jgi:predicted metal-dependent hydrolase
MAKQQITVRRIPFEFGEGLDPIWHKARHEWSHMVNGASVAMPYLEPFLIRTVREALGSVTALQMIEDASAFMGQQGAHERNHRRYNDILKSHYPELAEVETAIEADYERFQKRSLKWRLAYAAGIETMTIGLTEWLIDSREDLFAGADPSVASLVLWHMVEETEHKHVAHDLYMHMYGGYWARAWGLLRGSWHFALSSRKAYRVMLKRDGKWSDWRSRLRLYTMIARFFAKTAPALLRSLSPNYHPANIPDPDWVKRWSKAYDTLERGQLPLLDTKKRDVPAQFA